MNGTFFQRILTVLVALSLLAPGGSQSKAASAAGSATFTNEIKLVAQNLIDLAWDPSKYPYPEQRFKRWELFRGTSPNPIAVITSGEDETTDFFRNVDLDADTTYYYRLEIVRCVAPCLLPEHDRHYPIFSDSATTGVFQGTVTRDLNLSGGVYEIGFGSVSDSAAVGVAAGANLVIDGGATLKADPGVSHGGLHASGGSLFLSQVNVQDVFISFGDYYDPALPGGGRVTGCTFQNAGISLYSSDFVSISQNQGALTIFAEHQADAAITHNTFEGGIEVNRQASVVISYNTLTNADIDVSGYYAEAEPKASALISNNTILNQYQSLGVSVDGGASLTFTDNIIQWTAFDGDEASILVGAYGAGTTLTAQRNALSGGKIFASWGPKVDISDNVLLGGGSAITIGCLLCGSVTQAVGSIERNTVQSGWGFEMWAGSQALSIQHNCIRGNDPGLTVDDANMTSPLDVRHNYWGAASGPTHPNNPGGTGDRIEGYQVLFGEWDTTDAYCRAAPPAPPDSDLWVEQIKMIQVVEGVNPLVEAKPLAVKAVIASKQAVPLPVQVRLTIDGIIYDMFYEYTPESLHPASLQMVQPTTQVTFIEAGSKTVYFFPEQAPFGSSATAQVAIDPANQINEFDEVNNIRSVSQPVVKTYWGDNPQDQTLKVLSTPIDPGMLDVSDLYLAHFADQSGLADMLPVAPMDAWWQIQKTAPVTYNHFCLEDTKTTAEEIAKTEYRGLKLAYPDYQRFMILTLYTWFSGQSMFFSCKDLLNPTNGHLFSVSPSIPQLIFIEEDHWEDAYESGAGLAASYGLPVTDKPILVQGGLEVDTRRVVDHSVSQTLDRGEIHSMIGGGYMYGQMGWIDASNYQKLLERVDTPALQTAETAADGLVLVSGVVGLDDQVQFDPLFYLPAGAADATIPGSYAISLLDSSDAVLYSQEFSLSFESITSAPITQTAFAFALPYFPSMANMVLSKDGAPIGSLQASPHAPQVQVTSPNGGELLSGEQPITWSGTDLDGNPLTYAVLYTPDGGTHWETLAVDLTGTSYAWNTDDHPGAQSSGRIKVLASDGFLTGEDLSDAGFTVENKPPVTGIQAPFSGAVVTLGNALHLEGLARDPEDGWLEGADLSWSSDRDGPLGIGNSMDVELGYGEHIISLQATDSLGLTASSQITVTTTDSSDPDLSVRADLPANQQARAVCQPGWLGAEVRNIIADTYAWVDFYDGDPAAGGRRIGARKMYAQANSLNQTGIYWSPGDPGQHEVYILVSTINTYEANTGDNQTMLTVEVVPGPCPVYLPRLERR